MKQIDHLLTLMFKLHRHSNYRYCLHSCFPWRWTDEANTSSFALFRSNCSLNSWNTIHKFCSEKNICVIEHSFLQGNHNKLKVKITRRDEVNGNEVIAGNYIFRFRKTKLQEITRQYQQLYSTWECGKWAFIILPMFCVWLKSRAASTCKN